MARSWMTKRARDLLRRAQDAKRRRMSAPSFVVGRAGDRSGHHHVILDFQEQLFELAFIGERDGVERLAGSCWRTVGSRGLADEGVLEIDDGIDAHVIRGRVETQA